jgi:WD40 repeat protein
VAFSRDNRWVVTGSADKTARLWLLQENDLINLARIAAGAKPFR